jgi:hypothetical protein
MTIDDQFEKFVNQQNEKKKATEAFDPEVQLSEWREHLATLYREVDNFLSAYTEAGTIEIKKSDVQITEQYIGSYSVQNRIIIIGENKVILKPIGTLLVGSKGRVDVQGSAGSSRLVLINKKVTSPKQMIHVSVQVIPPNGVIDKPENNTSKRAEIEWAWKIVSRSPNMHFIELNKESFLQMLMEVNNA